ncbi:MAG: tRNA pseudouridine(38-40) synthase TruA [Gammaproteobacteria bacterium]|nr:tRNA pseudouridine(38-40) synthase TruA [Rhodocyclaceae bacterium]MBU3909981.1 tRNA pseudouridine(38-40) synthase TruA [Gammaproteobacteria bacterium]MBU3989087.1 tRNA pseudouridine(38-40) synthase TruA [Gammaproteobacteria bacterium]MBU4003954.1 tRNA pseudouridine(38-40) synthase TruA [Gammaproteobacteria bacterium]MBU4020201.1 tRNA pseudouridine(38-40) synthase TruA [Gammaproteobacteria bacterium]
MRIALGLEYDGAGFSGWQSQPCGNTVQDVLEGALSRIAGAPLRVVCAGRTDAGVHALAQVVHFDAEMERPLTAWVRGTNTFLPATVAVRWAVPVIDDFHARFSARARAYRYVLLNRPERPGVLGGKVGWCHRPLDVAAMQAAAGCLIGEHDFSAFRASGCQAKSPVKTLYRFAIASEGDQIIFDCCANAFLHHMVRNLVGALIYVGMHRHPPHWLGDLLATCDRREGAPTYAPDGLYLTGVDYGDEWGLPQQGSIMAHLRLPGS